MNIEKTLSIIKPDGVRRNLVGKILSRFEENNLRILSDSLILKSQGCLMMSKISSKKKGIRKIINLL